MNEDKKIVGYDFTCPTCGFKFTVYTNVNSDELDELDDCPCGEKMNTRPI